MLDSVKNILRTWIEGEFLFSEDYLVGRNPFLLFGHLLYLPGTVLSAGIR